VQKRNGERILLATVIVQRIDKIAMVCAARNRDCVEWMCDVIRSWR